MTSPTTGAQATGAQATGAQAPAWTPSPIPRRTWLAFGSRYRARRPASGARA